MRPKIAHLHICICTMPNRGNKHKGANRGLSGISPDHRSERCRSTVMRQINLVWHQQSVRGLLATGERERERRTRTLPGKLSSSFPPLFVAPSCRPLRGPSVPPSVRPRRTALALRLLSLLGVVRPSVAVVGDLTPVARERESE